ncbi:hypothetical protein T484DRAFT_1956019 [Baffinella frigidus]|nr:hypothetical protein T484DRAFT_1956019 [Cryptophyta sp. CCMP2293]
MVRYRGEKGTLPFFSVAAPDDEALLVAAWKIIATSRLTELQDTIDNQDATELVCFEHLRWEVGQECNCGGTKLHITGACGGAVNAALGSPLRRHCKKDPGECDRGTHPSRGEVRALLGEWWLCTRGREPVWGVAQRHNTAAKGTRAAEDAGGARGREEGGAEAKEETRSTVPAATQIARLQAHAGKSPYLSKFLAGPLLAPMLASDALRRLLAMKNGHKEITEACAMAAQVRGILSALGHVCEDGRGLTILDMCSGKGMTASLLALMLPAAKVTMFDCNGEMGLEHVAAIPNLDFRCFDVFSPDASDILAEAAGDASAAIVIGTHLCGALSPRLIDIFACTPRLDGLALCPCCLKGSIRGSIMQAARARGVKPYQVLVQTLKNLCESELGEKGTVDLVVDQEVLSPANAFIVATKRPL